MSILIDQLKQHLINAPQVGYKDGWYLARPWMLFDFWGRLRDAIRIMKGKSRAYHYKRDEGVKWFENILVLKEVNMSGQPS